jgi:hypothetical protein
MWEELRTAYRTFVDLARKKYDGEPVPDEQLITCMENVNAGMALMGWVLDG